MEGKQPIRRLYARIAVSNHMRPLKGNPGNPTAADPKQQFITRAQNLTGKPLKGIENLPLDFNALQGMSDDEMNSLLGLVQSLAPEDKGDVGGGISNVMSNLGEIKGVVQNLKENYNLDTEALLDAILKQRETGFVKRNLIKGAAKTAGLYAGGGTIRLMPPKR